MKHSFHTFQAATVRARKLTERHETALAEAYASTLRKAGRQASRRFRTAATIHSLAAAGSFRDEDLRADVGDPPSWTAPPVDELIDIVQVQYDLLTKTQGIREAAASDSVRPIMSAMGVSFSLESPLVQDLVDRAGVRAVKISIPGLRDAVIEAITQAFSDGLSVPDAAALIESKVEGLASFQSTMLARTDLIGTSNAGSLLAAKTVYPQAGLTKRWVNATDSALGDGRVRPTHLVANGQVQPIDGYFIVGGSLMLYPGDPSGDDDEVINCRCVVVYEESMRNVDATERGVQAKAIRQSVEGNIFAGGVPS